MSDLEQEILRLKRELAEAQLTIEDWRKMVYDERTKNLALSVSYQRQKEALEKIEKMPWENSRSPYAVIARQALAETPDVSLWQPIESAPKDGTSILVYPHFKVTHWCECSRGDNWAGIWDDDLDTFEPISWTLTHWQPLPPPPTLQPDHQK